jgi:uncharacterized protein
VQNKVIGAGALIVILAVFLYTLSGSEEDETSYTRSVEKHRREVNMFMANDADSPLTEEQKADFKGLRFYPIDMDFKVRARMYVEDNPEKITLSFTNGDEEVYLKYAKAVFRLKGVKQEVTLLKPIAYEDPNYIFFAFYDETSAIDTYGGGRYINLSLKEKGYINIDFNKAYSPYCAFNEEYICPIPLKENQINIAVTAGEMNYEIN